ncbi:MAG TPA: 16S rRNA (cytidine(1402)-2'-O)-methyltransferase [Candidatus Dormibacteraeota bacterium]|nr:16S rRNA (cytidine(1402)-2'-O)-methyltransferase [Candidatus Dormibacteraeota bacterium]
MAGEETNARGRLYLVATPVGNLEDITLRALRVLREADWIACEDTRQTRKLLARHEIDRPLVSYHEHNERERSSELIGRLEQGATVALVSDAGTPLVSDPGRDLVRLCLERQIPVIPIPGPSAFVAALVASGLDTGEFLFIGFLPPRAGERRRRLRELAPERRTLVMYEAPHRLTQTLGDALEIFGDRQAVVARELTKIHEEFSRGRLSELARRFQQNPPRGEITLLIAAPEQTAAETAPATATLAQRIAELERGGLDRKAALKQAAREYGIPKREAYRRLLLEDQET